jgi:hypothetical protein
LSHGGIVARNRKIGQAAGVLLGYDAARKR